MAGWFKIGLFYVQLAVSLLLAAAADSRAGRAVCLNQPDKGLAQTVRFKSRICTVEQVIAEIERQTTYTFIYSPSDIMLNQKVDIGAKVVTLAYLIGSCFERCGYGCVVMGRHMALNRKVPQQVVAAISSTRLFKGVVISSIDSTPVVGASIYTSDKAFGTTSDWEGQFSLKVDAQVHQLVVSALGYKPVSIPLSGSPSTVVLEPSMLELDEVCVIGYGAVPRMNTIGATQTVELKEMKPVGNTFSNLLSGRISGLGITESSGAIASANTLFFRGINSLFDEANAPLIVIDDIPLYGIGKHYNSTYFHNMEMPMFSIMGVKYKDVLNWMMGSEFERNPFSYINLNDVESIKVLKDTYSTSIFGSRASGGVVMITTKKGNGSPFKLNIGYSHSVSLPCNSEPLLSGAEYAKIYTTVYKKIKGLDLQFPSNVNTSWPKELIRAGSNNSVNVSGSGVKGSTKYYTSLSYSSQQAYIRNNNFNSITGRLNLSMPFSGVLSFSSANSISYVNNKSINAQTLYAYSLLKPSNISVFDENGEYTFGKGGNPVGAIYINPLDNSSTNYLKDLRVTSSNSLKVRLPWGFTWNSNAGVEVLYNRMLSMDTPLFSKEKELGLEELLLNYKIVADNFLELNRNSQYGHLFLTGGLSLEKSNEFRQRTQSKDVINARTTSNVNTVSIRENNEYALAAYFVRGMYSYRDRYLAGFTYRVDGSSRFSKMNRYAHSPALSVGWNLDKESWYDVPKLDNVKLRLSYGITNIDAAAYYYSRYNQYEFLNDVTYWGLPILSIKYQGIPQLKWETLSTLNAGVDLSAFSSSLNISVDCYHKVTHDMLIYSDVPLMTGAHRQLINGGKMQNRGVEVGISYRGKLARGLQWNLAANVASNSNKILSLGGATSFRTEKEGGYKNFEVGKAAGQFFLYDWAGVNPANGNPLWRLNDGTITEVAPEGVDGGALNRRNMGTATPLFFGGFSCGMEYANFKVDASFSFSYGNKLFNGTKATLMSYTANEVNNLSKDMQEYWKIKGHVTSVPALINKSIVMKPNGDILDYTISRLSSRFLEDASFVRMKSITATYTIPNIFKSGTEVKLYLQGLNLLTLTRYTGLDPEASVFGSSLLKSGYDEMTMPTAKTFIVGVNLSL
ncbi:SusC/RagA family TonB-linked outer membrane protein [Alistipes sp. ZOR0009]|uniref:SusC/RagA family TonB-linked outer membrane protein n=1 Tax=Alistipes sp. ZOR0009 TaxID=1339253 RepID=UPI0006459A5D|nr:SusC/RagA family TonB-linked outer membrane protein [Alistipes sp. ZOR0009]